MRQERKPLPVLLLALALLAVAGFFPSAGGGSAYLPRLLIAAGLGALLLGLVRAWPLIRVFLFRMREVAEPGPGLSWLLAGATLLVVSVGLNVSPQRLDLTSRGMHSLSSVSARLMENLPGEVELIGLFRDGDPAQDAARDILAVYRSSSRRIRTRLLDPERRPQEARELGVSRVGGIMVRSDFGREMLTRLDEPAITQAILRVSDPNRPVIGILEGHGENIAGGTSKVRGLLEDAGLDPRRLPLAEMGRVPDDVRVLLVFGPRTPLMPGEIGAVSEFLDRGGRLGLFVDPGHPSGLEDLLGAQGVEIDGRRIRDPGALTRSLGLGPETIAIRSFGEHPITRPMPTGLVLRGATRVGLPSTAIWGVDAAVLAGTGPEAHLLDPDAGEAGGSGRIPVAIAMSWSAVAGTGEGPGDGPRERPGARVVVIGDSDMLRDETIDLYGNREFMAKVVGWLAEREFLLAFPRADTGGTPLNVGLTGLRTLFYLLQIVLPLLLFGAGIAVWIRRR